MVAITPQVKKVIDTEGISTTELAEMVDHSAKSSQRGHNRRYHSWLFRVAPTGTVESMISTEFKVVGSGENAMWEEHDACAGAGCHECGWVGEIVRKIRGN